MDDISSVRFAMAMAAAGVAIGLLVTIAIRVGEIAHLLGGH